MLGLSPVASAPLADIGIAPDVYVYVTGVQGDTALGTATLVTNNIISVAGLLATGRVGTATITGNATVSPNRRSWYR